MTGIAYRESRSIVKKHVYTSLRFDDHLTESRGIIIPQDEKRVLNEFLFRFLFFKILNCDKNLKLKSCIEPKRTIGSRSGGCEILNYPSLFYCLKRKYISPFLQTIRPRLF